MKQSIHHKPPEEVVNSDQIAIEIKKKRNDKRENSNQKLQSDDILQRQGNERGFDKQH